MAFTDFCDVSGAVHEDGFNRVIHHVMSQRPSLFHYGTDSFVKDYRRLCCPPESVHPEVIKRGNPIVTRLEPLAIPGYEGGYGLEYNFSIAGFSIDFEPSNKIILPPELNPPLKPQSAALQGVVCGGIGCPERELLDKFVLPSEPYQPDLGKGIRGRKIGPVNNKEKLQNPLQALPYKKVHCFRLSLFAVINFAREDAFGVPVLGIKLQNLELVDLKPEGLENSLECFIRTALVMSILPKLRIAISALTYSIEDFMSIGPTPISAQVPFNPSIEVDALTVKLSITT